jgi:hypothetical protein
MQAKFPRLTGLRNKDVKGAVDLIRAAFILHNFIRISNDEIDNDLEMDEMDDDLKMDEMDDDLKMDEMDDDLKMDEMNDDLEVDEMEMNEGGSMKSEDEKYESEEDEGEEDEGEEDERSKDMGEQKRDNLSYLFV